MEIKRIKEKILIMTYKKMTTTQPINEIARVKELMVLNKKPHTYHQNRKYLQKLEGEYKKRNETD